MTSANNEMILASAGTGKTYALSSRYLRLLVDGVDPASVLATTFTRKAAGEILDRIIQRLADAALDENAATFLAKDLDRSGCSSAIFAELLATLTAQLNNLQVQTLDAFFAQLARSFSLDLGLPPDWEIADENEMQRLQNYAIRISLADRMTLGIVHDLSKGEARRGISSMIRGMIGNLYGIYRETADDNRLAAWDVLTERPMLSDTEIEELDIHLQATASLADGKMLQALEQDIAAIAARDWPTLLSKGLGLKVCEQNYTYYKKAIPAEIVDALRPFVDHAIAIQINTLVRQTAAARQMLEIFHRRFDRLKLEEATLRFDDVNYLASQLLRDYSAGQFAFRLDKQIDHLLLDEFQDTSIEQWKVLEPVASRACSRGPNRSFFCVGDVKQAIYGWRGGVAEIFDEVVVRFGDSLEKFSHLNKSWRSSPVVIELVNQTFTNIAALPQLDDRRPPFQSWCDKFRLHETERSKLPGYATLETSDSDQHLPSTAKRIQSLAEQHPDKSIGVLARTNKQIAELIFELGLLGVRASEEGGNPLTDSAAVNLVLSGLRLVDHPDDSAARFHVLHSPLGKHFGLTNDNWLLPESACRQAAQRFRCDIINHGYGSVFRKWASILGTYCTPREWFRLNQLVERGYRVSAADHTRTADFIEFVEQTRVPDPSAAQVRVMTVHKSKGLEFDIVVLPFMDFLAGRPPAYIVGRDNPTGPIQVVCHYMDSVKREWMPTQIQRAFERDAEYRIHEMLSVIYVSMTRARHGLHIIANHKTTPNHKSAIGLIMGALKVEYDPKKSDAGQVLWSNGDPNWEFPVEPPPGLDKVVKKQVPGREAADESAVDPVRFSKSRNRRPLSWESPSSREGSSTINVGQLLRLENNRDARIAGSLLHSCFEQVHWLDDWKLDEEALRIRLRGIIGSNPDRINATIAEFKTVLENPNLKHLLSRAFYSTPAIQDSTTAVVNERKFAVRVDDRILNGSIDRLVITSTGGDIQSADIVDFKTDSLTAGDASAVRRRTEIYRPQLMAYRDAVSHIYRLPMEQITARLMYVAIDQQVQIV